MLLTALTSAGRPSMIKSIDYSELEKTFSTLRIKMTVSDFTNFAMQKDFSAEQICSVIETFSLLAKRKEQASINFLLKCSRLPLKNPKTFDNFRFEDIKGRDSERLKSLSTLAALHSHKNLAFIGPAGTGKTHLAMASLCVKTVIYNKRGVAGCPR